MSKTVTEVVLKVLRAAGQNFKSEVTGCLSPVNLANVS